VVGDDGVSTPATSGGLITFNGTTVANGTNVKPLYIRQLSTNTEGWDIQLATASATLSANLAGLCYFNQLQFTIDANGRVSLLGGSGPSIETVTGDDSVVVVPSGAGNINLRGLVVGNSTFAKAVFVESPSANSEAIAVQVGAAIASTDITKVGLLAANSAQFTVDANGFFSITNFSPFNYTNVNFAASPYTVLATDYFLSVDSSGGAITIRLPNAPTQYRRFIIKDRTGNASTNNITYTTVGGAVLIDGATSKTITGNYGAVELLFNGTSYEVY